MIGMGGVGMGGATRKEASPTDSESLGSTWIDMLSPKHLKLEIGGSIGMGIDMECCIGIGSFKRNEIEDIFLSVVSRGLVDWFFVLEIELLFIWLRNFFFAIFQQKSINFPFPRKNSRCFPSNLAA